MTGIRLGTPQTQSWPRFGLGLALVLVALIPPGIYAVDGNSMFAVAYSLASHGSVKVPCSLAGTGGTGSGCYSIWYPLLSFLAAPLVLAGRLFGKAFGLPEYYAAKELALLIPALAAAGSGLFTALIADKMGASRRGAVLAGFAVTFGTEMLTYSRTFFAETLAAFLVAVAVWAAGESDRRRYVCWAALALSVLAKPQMLLVGPAIGSVLAMRARSLRPFITHAVATGAGAAVYLVYNAYRFGAPLDFGGPQRLHFGDYLPLRLFSGIGLLLVSPGKGLLWYSPVAAVGIWQLWRGRRNTLQIVCAVVSLAILLVYLSDPGGGWDWGDRFLVPALPLLCAPLGLLRGRLVAVAVAASVIGLVTQIPTTVGFFERTYAEHAYQGDNLGLHRWSLRESPLVTSWGAMTREVSAAQSADVSALVHSAGGSTKPKSVKGEQLLQVVALWWWLVPAVHLPRTVGAVVFLIVIGIGLALAAGAARSPARASPAAAHAEVS